MNYNDVYDEKKSQALDWEFAGQIHEENPFTVKFIGMIYINVLICYCDICFVGNITTKMSRFSIK